MKTMPSSSSDNSRKISGAEKQARRDGSSFSRLFSVSLLAFFVLQVLVGTAVIVLFIGNEMSKMQVANVKSELSGRSQRLISYLEDRLLILHDYSKLPVLVTGVMQPDDHLANTVDFMESLNFLNSEAQFTLQDFQGKLIYSNWPFRDSSPSESFQKLMNGELEEMVTSVVVPEGSLDCCYWKLSVPVKYQGLPEGVFSAYLPIRLGEIFPEVKGDVRVVLQTNGKMIASRGEAAEPTIALESGTGFPGIILQQAVSRQAINDRIEFLIFIMVAALTLGTALVLGVVRYVGKKTLLVPHERLQVMRDELEKEVEKRTADLKMRTVQLSIEIRERREAELEARETGQLVSALLEGIGAAFLIINPDNNKIVRSNAVVHKMFGLAPWQLSEQSCLDLFSGFPDSMTAFSCPETINVETYTEGIAKHVDGHTFPVSRYLVPMEIQGQAHIGVIVFDVTERKNLERRLNVAQKLESVGELASGIAHEINTPIQYVGDSVRFVQEATSDIVEILKAEAELIKGCKDAGEFQELIERIEELAEDADLEFVIDEIPNACTRALEGTERVASIVRAMKNFAHPGTGEMSAVDINQALDNTIMVSKNEWKYVADIVRDYDPVPTVMCLPGDINQVLLNVLINAAHAIGDVVKNSGEKGTITISTRANENELTISIADTGTGIPAKVRDKIFDPFFTTKEVGRGTGQGLAIVHDIVVERHGGSIDIESEVGKGTTFIVNLPLRNN